MDGKERASGKMMTIEIGPWGGNGGADWDDGIYNGVREIKIAYCLCIDSITVVYDRNGKPVKAETHGNRGDHETAEIKLQYPGEFLVGVSGHYCPMMFGIGPRLIRSLKFQSNRRTFGPYGIEEGTPFTFTVDGGQIVGLKGRNGWYLDAIGFHVSPPPTEKFFQSIQKTIVIEPWGGNGGADWDDGIYNGVREIKIAYCLCIDSIAVVYDRNGMPVKAETHGNRGDHETAETKLQYPDEFLVGVSGHYCPMMFGIGPRLIRSLKFQSNRRTFGPYGIEEGTPFTFTVDGGQIVGLKGRNGWYLDAIGFHVSPSPTEKFFQSIQKTIEIGPSIQKTIVIGPWGGNGGADWDDGIYNGVREIKIAYGLCINSITMVYDRNGKPVKAETHGGRGGNQTAEIKLQYPDEFLVGVSGHYCPMMFGIGPRLIRSLKFHSNRRTFGPYGIEKGTPFTFTLDGGKIVGLKGRNRWYLRCHWVSCIPSPNLNYFRAFSKF